MDLRNYVASDRGGSRQVASASELIVMTTGDASQEKLICEKSICEVGSSGLILPAFGDREQRWATPLRIVLYLLLLLWFFMGVAIVADVFMGAIEKITSKKYRAWDPKLSKYHTCTVWNDTVANLTLMALGSSAPEILLSLIELFGNSFYSGKLGPSTIVGSAAFNLFCITAVCITAIPDGDARTIKDVGVFFVTAIFSILAYVWLLIIVTGSSRDVVDIWESAVTFLLFPLLVVLAFAADKGYFNLGEVAPDGQTQVEENVVKSLSSMSKEELARVQASVQMRNSLNLTVDQLAKVIESEFLVHRSRAAYRVAATRAAVGGRRVHIRSRVAEVETQYKVGQVVPEVAADDSGELTNAESRVILQFTAYSYAVMENIGEVCIPVQLVGAGFQKCVSVDFETRDGSAKAGSDYVPVRETLLFHPGESQKEVKVKIIDDAAYEDDEMFMVELKNPRCSEMCCKVQLGEPSKAMVAILDDDRPGVLAFEEECVEELEQDTEHSITAVVLRKGGCRGQVSCLCRTESDTAIEHRDFIPVDQRVTFAHGQSAAKVDIVIKPVGRYERSESFRVVLSDPDGGCCFDKKTDGGESCCIMTVIIKPNAEVRSRTDKVMAILLGNWDKTKIGQSNWKDQFRDALLVVGGDDEETRPSRMDYVMHAITIFWKVLFACIPPVDFCDGWLCFFTSLLMIGLVTAFIADIAGLLGCVMTLPDEITAITFVALGTSLPDTFASKAAAVNDPYADASVGNVTGSNSVNVFLGLGLPWLVGAVYWAVVGKTDEWVEKYPNVARQYPDGGKFVVIGGDLGFSVTVFCVCASMAICILMLRRKRWNAELGGPSPFKQISGAVMASLWLVYVALSSWKVLDTRSKDPCNE